MATNESHSGGDSGNNVAIIAIIVIAILVAGAAFLYFQGDVPDANPTVVERTTERNTIIENDAPAPPPAPAAPAENNTEGDFSFSQETDSDGDTETEIEATTD